MLGRFYVIIDDTYVSPEEVKDVAIKVLRGGAEVIQLRSKRWDRETLINAADTLYSVLKDYGVPLIINDYVDVAERYNGVHVGAEDLPYGEVRRRMGKGKIVGVSCYGSLETALKMQEDGADYVAFSSPYPSPTKPDKDLTSMDLIREASRALHIPFYVIGGIDEERAKEVIRAGAYGVAVVSAILKSEDPEEAARRLKDAVYSSL